MTPSYRCDGCGYGVATGAPPLCCPMCRGGGWTYAGDWGREPLTVRRLGSSTFLITPPSELDAAASVLLGELVAEFAYEHPEVVVDLTAVRVVDGSAARLLLRLGALAHGSGGRLLAVCPSRDARDVEIHELDAVDDADPSGIGGALGRALRSVARH